MRLDIMLFAVLKEAQRAERISLDLPAGSTVGDLKAAVAREFPSLAAYLPSARVASALRFAPDHHVIGESEPLALIPPVSGG
ncbi:MAG TPA: MoaD/ThiS family protein [Pantanalinema sp.]